MAKVGISGGGGGGGGGTPSNVTVVNGAGASAVNIQDGGNSITVDNATLAVVGGGVEAAALRVTIANDSTGVLSVDDNGGSLTVDGTVAATQSGTWNINNISGTISLPTGAATAALQTQPGIDIGDVTINNASGAAAVNIQDGGNSITIDGTVAVSGTVAVTQSTSPWVTADNQTIVDNAGFTDGTSKVFVSGYIFDEVAGTALTENDAAASRIDSKRAQVLVIEDETTRGRRTTVTAANALKVDNSGVTQPVSAASLPLPTGAATETSLAAILGKYTSPTATLSNVSASATSVTVLALNTARESAIFYNDSTSACYLKFGTTASATSFSYKLSPAQTLIVDGIPVYTGIVTGIWDSATGTMRVTELT